ncbi:MAG: aminotransferase class III-fold pyridoxal phosphate-dependent enzyme [Deltaproteobacteria bacterium]|nr:aminotransferase class III-fold pyridoxal phosphate-dependent enzyme [Deltaproteobacteria bacterium]
MSLYKFNKSNEMFQRATAVIPSGISGNKNPAFAVPGSFPYFAERGEGCRYWDVDGNEYIDYLCGYGPIILGHNHPAVDEAARKQQAMGSAFNHPTVRSVELAERLVSMVPVAEWVAIGRNGSDVTAYAVQVAREHTQRRKIIMAKGAYHGSQSWCRHGIGGLIEADYEHVLQFDFNDATQLSDLVKQHEGDVATVILTPYHHPAFGDQVMPAPGFMEEVRRICDENGIVFIIDDVRAGFRLDMGGSNEYFGYKPDMICFCKGMANGYCVSAACGHMESKNAASRVFFTGTYYTNAVEIAAAMACLDELENTKAIDKMMKTGTLLQEGLRERAGAHGLQVSVTGPPTLPFMTFANESNFLRSQMFSGEAARRGVILHPHHNWFMMAAHEESDVMKTIEVADRCFAIVKKQFGD